MFFTWFSPKRRPKTNRRGSGLSSSHLRLEQLEDRCVPAGTISILSVQGPSSASAVVPAAVAGNLTSPALIATFTDSNAVNPNALSVRIDYGDGAPVQSNQPGPNFDPNLQVTQIHNNPTQYIVSDKHDFTKTLQAIQPYQNGDTFPITLTVSEMANPTNTDTNTTGTAEVLAAPLAIGPTPPSVTATAGTVFTGPIANFVDTDTNVTADDFTAVIHWGDGHTSNGTIQADVNGGFDVVGTNTYATAGNYPLSVVVTNVKEGPGAGGVQPSLSVNVTVTVNATTGSTTTGGTTTGGTTGGTTTGGTTTGGTTTGGTTTGGSTTTGGTTTGGTTTGGTTTGGTTTGGTTTGGTTTGGTTTGGSTTGGTTTGTSTTLTVQPSVSVGYGPHGEGALLIVNSQGVLTQYNSYGAEVYGGGVEQASVAFDPLGGEVVLLVRPDGSLTQYDSSGSHFICAGVTSADVFFSPVGEVVEIVRTDGSLTQYDAYGAHQVASSGVVAASGAYTNKEEVLLVTQTNGTLVQYDSGGTINLTTQVADASMGFSTAGEEVFIISQSGILTEYGATGVNVIGSLT